MKNSRNNVKNNVDFYEGNDEDNDVDDNNIRNDGDDDFASQQEYYDIR